MAECNVPQGGHFTVSSQGWILGSGGEKGCSRQPYSQEVWSGEDVDWQPSRTLQSQMVYKMMMVVVVVMVIMIRMD